MNLKYLLPALMILLCPTARAQDDKDKDKEEKPPVFNYVIDDPMDKFQPQKDSVITYHYLVPEFYFHTTRKDKDTTFEFFCYDVHDELIPSVTDFDSVFYYSEYKSFTDSAHTYIDSAGKEQLLPVASICKRFDKTGTAKWMAIEYPSNKFAMLKADKNAIVARDTVMDYKTGGAYIYRKIYSYYKLSK
jgi:hypothetical protein